MGIRRFYTERLNLRPGSSVKLPEDEGEHIKKSLRMEKGDEIVLFNGEEEFKAKLTLVSADAVMAEIVEVINNDFSESKEFTVFLSLIRIPNFELVLQKLTELGVSRIVPVESEYCQVKLENLDRKFERWNKIIIEACKQSERKTIPELVEPIKFNEISNFVKDFDSTLFFTVPRYIMKAIAPVRPVKDVAGELTGSKIAYIVGPEGGFSTLEHKQAAEWKLPFVSLGDQILKAETAAIAAQAVLNALIN